MFFITGNRHSYITIGSNEKLTLCTFFCWQSLSYQFQGVFTSSHRLSTQYYIMSCRSAIVRHSAKPCAAWLLHQVDIIIFTITIVKLRIDRGIMSLVSLCNPTITTLKMFRYSANSRNGGSLNTSAIWLSTAERRSQRRPSPTQNGAVKETLIPEEKTTNVDAELDISKKVMPSPRNASLRIGFVIQDDAALNSIPVATSSNAANTVGRQHPQCSSDGGSHHRTPKPAEWRVHLAHVKVRFTNQTCSLKIWLYRLAYAHSQAVRRIDQSQQADRVRFAARY